MKPFHFTIAALLIVLQSCSVEVTEETTVTEPAQVLPIVTTKKIDYSQFQHYVEVQGTIHADKIATLTAEMGGLIRVIHVEKGQRVNAGQTLVTLDSDVLRKNIEEVKKSLELADFVYEKQKNLHEQNVGSELQYQQAKNNKERLEQTLKTLESQLSMTVISAPFDGVIDDIFPKIGEMAAPGVPVIRLINLRKVHIEAEVMESYLRSVTKSKMVDVRINSMDTMIYNVPIVRTGKYINPANRTFVVQVDINNTDERLLPNMIAILRIKDEVMDSVLAVPNEALLQSSAGVNYLYVVYEEDGKELVRKIDVEPGASDDTRTVVYPLYGARSQLRAGDRIVVEGARGVKQGMQVKVKN
ncbi:MAG: efflux RND transporter periplasmic adaptor subunit [Flavobacteriales bacterium]